MLQFHQFTFNPFQENTYLLYDNHKRAALVDPGNFFQEETDLLLQTISDENLTLEKILLTHAHLDHVFGLKFFSEKFNLQPILHKWEMPVLALAGEAGIRWNIPFDAYTGPVHFVAEGEELTVGDAALRVLLVPGHSPGHIAYHHQEQKLVFSGDVLFLDSIGRTDLPGADFDQLMESIRTTLLPLDEATTVHAGHGPATTIGREKKSNPYLQGS